MNAVTRLIASCPAVLEGGPHRREDIFLLLQSRLGQHFFLTAVTDEVENLVNGDAPDQFVVGIDDRRRNEVVAPERVRRLSGLFVLSA
jgi:hypothetical protein